MKGSKDLMGELSQQFSAAGTNNPSLQIFILVLHPDVMLISFQCVLV